MIGRSRLGNTQLSCLYMGGFFIALSFYLPSINYCLASHFDYVYSWLATAVILYLFAILGLAFVVFDNKAKAFSKSTESLVIFCLSSIFLIWLINHFFEYATGSIFSDYDNKRLGFAVHGIVITGSIGVFGVRDPSAFLKGLLKCSCISSAILAILYLGLYDDESSLSRIGGDAGLVIGILLGQGVGSVLVMVRLKWLSKWLGLIFFLILFSGIVMSGTRSALTASAVSVFLFLIRESRGQILKNLIFYSLLAGCVAVLLFPITQFVPDSTIERITNFNLEGSEDRFALLGAAWDIFSENPLGKTSAFKGLFPAEIEYSHNTTVQVVAEVGLFAIPTLMLLFFGVFRSVVVNEYSNLILREFLIYAVVVYLTSFSAGDAYYPQYWLVTAFLSRSGLSVCFKKIS